MNKSEARIQSKLLYQSAFILEGTSSTTIEYNNKSIPAAIIVNADESGDEVILFSLKKDGIKNGEFFFWNESNYFIFYKVKSPFSKLYEKFYAYESNILYEIEGQQWGGYFLNNLTGYQDNTFLSKIFVEDATKPVLVSPKNEELVVGRHIAIGKRGFKIISIDDMTNKDIYYMSLQYAPLQFESDVPDRLQNSNELYAGQVFTVETEEGYFSTNIDVEVLNITTSSVTFRVPRSNKIVINVMADSEVVIKEYIII